MIFSDQSDQIAEIGKPHMCFIESISVKGRIVYKTLTVNIVICVMVESSLHLMIHIVLPSSSHSRHDFPDTKTNSLKPFDLGFMTIRASKDEKTFLLFVVFSCGLVWIRGLHRKSLQLGVRNIIVRLLGFASCTK